ncbi:MAG TPA: hypothetical protein DDY91_03410 [Planctomycetaceae bacterium]|nr:hypothetical protein [Planctomycetaceae bacterium]
MVRVGERPDARLALSPSLRGCFPDFSNVRECWDHPVGTEFADRLNDIPDCEVVGPKSQE